MENNLLKKIEDAISSTTEGKPNESINILINNIKYFEEYEDVIRILSSRYKTWKIYDLKGISNDIDHNKIRSDLLDTLNLIKNNLHGIKIASAIDEIKLTKDKIPIDKIFTHQFFPNYGHIVPFGSVLETLFFGKIPLQTKFDDEFHIHGPNVIRFIKGLLSVGDDERNKIFTSGLFKKDQNPKEIFLQHYGQIINNLLEIKNVIRQNSSDKEKNEKELAKIIDLLSIAALYHDIGKCIRRPNHPQLGANMLKYLDQKSNKDLIQLLKFPNDQSPESMHNRFALITSIVQHHDKFGVVSTGEAGLPIFSDILYFSSDGDDEKSILGIKKNITAVMLLNLADIAAVNTADDDTKKRTQVLSNSIFNVRKKINQNEIDKSLLDEESELLKELSEICVNPNSCLGLDYRKISTVIDDWQKLIHLIDSDDVKGDRTKLKNYLLLEESKPVRTIKRVLRLLQECVVRANIQELSNQNYLSQTLIESVFISTLGSHQFQSFCQNFAMIVKMDYSLKFFKSIATACVRKKIYNNDLEKVLEMQDKSPEKLTHEEYHIFIKMEEKYIIAQEITTIIIKVLESLVSRYSSILTQNAQSLRRFGFQLRELTDNKNIWINIIRLLCLETVFQNNEPIALTWIVDEISIWSFD